MRGRVAAGDREVALDDDAAGPRGAEEAGTSRATTIAKLAMPGLTFAGSEHSPGGGVLAVKFAQPRLD